MEVLGKRSRDGCSKSLESIYDKGFHATRLLAKDAVHFNADRLGGKVVVIANVASQCGLTKKNYEQYNMLKEKYGDKVEIFPFPCNQFGNQENFRGEEIVNALRHVRPGNNFEPKGYDLMEKVEVNGKNSHPLFKSLRLALPFRNDSTLEKEMEDPIGVQSMPERVNWSPTHPSDIVWNFETFVLDKQGKPAFRFGPGTGVVDNEEKIAELISA